MGADDVPVPVGETTATVNLARIVDGHDPDRTALISRNQTITYGDLTDRCDRLRGGLAAMGIGDGDRVALLCGNGHPFVVAYFAILGLGAVAVPLNPSSPASELTRELSAVEAKAVVLDRSAAGAWRAVDRSSVASIEHVLTVDGADAEGTALEALLDAEPRRPAGLDPAHLAALMFTSGTAGAPKAAMLTHGNLLANLEQARSTLDRISADDVVYGVIPLHHIFGLNVVLGLTLLAGGSVVLIQRFDPATAIESIRARGVTMIPGVPSMWASFAHFDEAPPDAFAGVRIASSGAAKLPIAVAERCLERFGLSISEGYGLTEAAPIVASSTGLEPRFGSVGKVLAGIEVRVVDDDGGDALVGDAGEIWVRGANVFPGYLDDAEATARVLTDDGWLRTGDVALVDDDGWLHLVDRAKDLVIVSGFNVFPAEVEEVLVDHPDVAEVGVIGVPHPHTGEAVRAYVVLQPGATIDEEGLIDHARDHLARYKCPNKVLFVDELPRNASGKLVRRQLDGLNARAEPAR